jgi:hypothetical protein
MCLGFTFAQTIDDAVLHDTMALDTPDTTEVLLLVDLMENAVVHQDSAIYQLMMDKYLGIERGVQEVSGFRVQVYSSNVQIQAKNEAMLLHQELSKQLTQAIYIISEPPFWKVRVGDFRTREEANAHKETLLKLYPILQSSTYVVPDKVTVYN